MRDFWKITSQVCWIAIISGLTEYYEKIFSNLAEKFIIERKCMICGAPHISNVLVIQGLPTN